MADPGSDDPHDHDALQARLKDLSGALDTHRKAAETRQPTGGFTSPDGMGQAMSLGFRVMSEFVAAVVVGGFIGWAIDRWLGSSPAALIVFLGLGTAAGFWNVYRIAMQPSGPRAPKR
jgi:ATP synthase protein I